MDKENKQLTKQMQVANKHIKLIVSVIKEIHI